MKTYIYLLFFTWIIAGCTKESNTNIPDQTEINKLKLNQIQILGSHNSYHKHMPNNLFSFLSNINFLLPAEYKVEALDYYHEPFEDQLDIYQMRGFEIDLYADPSGGRFYNRQGNLFAQLPVASGVDELKQPGFKVLHIPDIDYETHFYTFKSALQFLKTWSDAHPNHIPIFLHIETKESTVGDILGFLGFTTAIKFTPALCDDIDKEIKSVFGDALDKVITPDKVRGSFATLEEAVLAASWPTIGESRGKFVFVMEGGGDNEYLQGHPSFQGRAMFLYMDNPGTPESAFLKYNDAAGDETKIKSAVEAGYIIRTRADGPNGENRTGSYANQEAAFRSGGQIISTDYYRPDPRYETQPTKFTNYKCQFPNGDLARINPVSAADKKGIGKIAE